MEGEKDRKKEGNKEPLTNFLFNLLKLNARGASNPLGHQINIPEHMNNPKNPLYKKQICKTCRQPLPKQLELAKSKISQKELDEFSECFRMFDKDGDGTIDVKELGAVLRSLGNNPTEEDIEEMVDDADEDGSGSINFPEFIALMLKRQQSGESKEEIKQIFRVFDKDGNGFVSTSELKFVMGRMGVNFTDDELNEMVMEADIDGDGQVCFEEFYNMMTAS